MIIYYIIGYRKEVVKSNIKTAFPEKSEQEVEQITKDFFKHFTDLVFESIKAFTISEKEIRKRYTYENIDIINKLTQKGKSIALTGSHQNNWEYSLSLPLHVSINCFAAYTRINNPYFEKYLKKSRMKFGYDVAITYDFKKRIQYREENNIQSLYTLLSDQSPQLVRTKYWTNFLGKFVPVHTGAEILAKKYDFAVVHMNVLKVKRGFYNATFELITETPRNFKDYEIAEIYLKRIEENIRKQPENYLWSHKRFKLAGKHEEWLSFQKNNN